MRILKSKKKRQAELQVRAARMGRIILAAGAASMEDPVVADLIASGALREAMEEVASLPLGQAEAFLDMLEAGVPEALRHLT
jgi:hypothetical protein